MEELQRQLIEIRPAIPETAASSKAQFGFVGDGRKKTNLTQIYRDLSPRSRILEVNQLQALMEDTAVTDKNRQALTMSDTEYNLTVQEARRTDQS